MDAFLSLLDAIARNAPAMSWCQAQPALIHERNAIEKYLTKNDRPAVYGFDTLLGQLDGVRVEGGLEHPLLAAHLMGRLESISALEFNVISAVKLQQMSLGGSGVHPETYAAVLKSFGKFSHPAEGAWRDSYSSGDVVPAAWWVKNLLDSHFVSGLCQGDTIALINGNFVSTAQGIIAFQSLENYVAQFLAVSGSFVNMFPDQGAGSDALAELARLIWPNPRSSSWEKGGRKTSIQSAISARDGRLYLDTAVGCLRNLAQAIDSRLTNRSSNPQFHITETSVRSLSQASFLGFELTYALTNAQQMVSLLMGGLQRFAVQRSEQLQSEMAVPSQRLVQPPKISRAIVESTRLRFGALPLSFTGSESGGVEDVWDLSLSTANNVLAMVTEARSQFVSLNELNGGQDFASVEHTQQIRAALREAVTAS